MEVTNCPLNKRYFELKERIENKSLNSEFFLALISGSLKSIKEYICNNNVTTETLQAIEQLNSALQELAIKVKITVSFDLFTLILAFFEKQIFIYVFQPFIQLMKPACELLYFVLTEAEDEAIIDLYLKFAKSCSNLNRMSLSNNQMYFYYNNLSNIFSIILSNSYDTIRDKFEKIMGDTNAVNITLRIVDKLEKGFFNSSNCNVSHHLSQFIVLFVSLAEEIIQNREIPKLNYLGGLAKIISKFSFEDFYEQVKEDFYAKISVLVQFMIDSVDSIKTSNISPKTVRSVVSLLGLKTDTTEDEIFKGYFLIFSLMNVNGFEEAVRDAVELVIAKIEEKEKKSEVAF